MRLTAHIADGGSGDPPRRPSTAQSPVRVPGPAASALERQILELQRQIEATGNGFQASPILAYEQLLSDIQHVVDETVPQEATVLVISRGDDEALALGSREAWHFPQDSDGTYAGTYPENSEEAVAHLEELHARGAQYLLVPSTSSWWLDHYDGFARHLREHYRPLAEARGVCAVRAGGGSR